MPFLTPDFMPGSVTRHISINRSLLPVIMGSLFESTILENWEPFGSMTPGECADLALEAFLTMTGPMIGTVGASLGSLPSGCLWLDGTSYPVGSYPDLASVIDPGMISDGVIHLPDLTGRFLYGGTVVGVIGGESEHTLTLDEIPPHNHGEHTHLNGQVTGEIPTPVPDLPIPQPFSDRGGGQPHNNLPPYFTVKYYVVAQ